MEVLKRDGTLRAEAANILGAMERLNQAATAKEIADVYEKQYGNRIGKGYLDAVLADAHEKHLVFEDLKGNYEITAKGCAYLKSYRSANAFGVELKPKTEEKHFESKAAKTPENKNQTASISRAEARLAQKKNTERTSKREATGVGQQSIENEMLKVLRALKGANSYAASGQIAREYERQNRMRIDRELLKKALQEAEREKFLEEKTSDYYKLLPEGDKMVKKYTDFNVNDIGETVTVGYGSPRKATEDDIFCPFCKLYYPFGTINCPKCDAEIGDKYQKCRKTETSAKRTTVQSNAYNTTKNSSQNSGDGGIGASAVAGILLGCVTLVECCSSFADTMGTLGTGSEDVAEVAGFSWQFGPVGSSTVATLGSGAVAGGVYATSGGSDYIPIWEDSFGNWHIGDNVPYSVVEKRAETIYDVLHGQKSDALRQPIIIAKTREQTEMVNRIFRTQRGDAAAEKLDLWISLLEKDEYVS